MKFFRNLIEGGKKRKEIRNLRKNIKKAHEVADKLWEENKSSNKNFADVEQRKWNEAYLEAQKMEKRLREMKKIIK